MNKLLIIPLIFAIGILLYFIPKHNVTKQQFPIMGTSLEIVIAEDNIPKNIFSEAFKQIRKVENVFKKNPDINNPDVQKLFNLSKELYHQTNGIFSPYLGSVIKLWGFDNYTKQITKVPTSVELKKALAEKQINLYAAAKGFGIDQIAQYLKSQNINNFLINAGGDIFVSGSKFGKPWIIQLQEANKSLSCPGLKQYSVASSSNLYNYYMLNGKKWGHLLNGQTGLPVEGEKAISVLASNATLADAYATAFFVDEKLIPTIAHLGVIKTTNQQITTYNIDQHCIIK